MNLTREDAANLLALLRRTERLCSLDESAGVAMLRQKLIMILNTPEEPSCSSESSTSSNSSPSDPA